MQTLREKHTLATLDMSMHEIEAKGKQSIIQYIIISRCEKVAR